MNLEDSIDCILADAWPRANPVINGRGLIRSVPEDFQVEEQLGFEPDGAGEFDLLWVEKRGANTAHVAERLAEYAGLPVRAISFSGLKDRHALTWQWFSVHLPGLPSPAWADLKHPEFQVLKSSRHQRKLRRGSHQANRFRITIRAVSDLAITIDASLKAIAERGFPNYFGSQRFGIGGQNLLRAGRYYGGEIRVKRSRSGMLHSAARSLIFNQQLAKRVTQGSWNQPQAGDVFGLDRRGSVFGPTDIDEDIQTRCRSMDIHPTGPMWGRGEPTTAGEVAESEREVASMFKSLAGGLERAGLKQERRPLRCRPEGLNWRLQDQQLVLEFALPKGAFATTLLREVIHPMDNP